MSFKNLVAMPALAAIALLSACASTPETESAASASGRDCFRATDVTNYRLNGPTTVQVEAGATKKYLLTITPNANDLDFSGGIALNSSPSNLICTGSSLGVEIIAGDTPQSRRFSVTYVARLMTDGS
ncbi:MAG: DUF6491 family protein [Caulobacterales bacterium]